ncbi:MAG: hypothetical protein Q9166_000963 [cf. Caloplaca sp. 2 TL-2023]
MGDHIVVHTYGSRNVSIDNMSPHVVETNADLAEIVGDEPSEPFPHLWTRLSEYAIGHGDHPAVRSFYQHSSTSGAKNETEKDVVWSYSELHAKVELLAATLHGLGVRKGDAIAVSLDNRAEWALFFWVSVRLDTVYVTLNPRLIQSKGELNHVLGVTKPRVLAVLTENDAIELEQSTAGLITHTPIRVIVSSIAGDIPSGWTGMGDLMLHPAYSKSTTNGLGDGEHGKLGEHVPSPSNDLDQTMMVIFTSGTTSLPKASFSTYGNILASALACKTFRQLNDPSCSLLQQLPVFHSWSVCVSLAFWITGATVVYPSKSFDARATLSAIESAECTHMLAVPSMIQALVSHPSLPTTNLQSLQSVDLGGTIILPEIVEACMDKLGAQYSSVGYGMTEGSYMCSSALDKMSFNRHNIPKILPCGTAMPGGRLRVCRPGSREVLKRGEIGELHMGGPQVTRGYLDRKSEDFYQEDGVNWLVTGDQAQIDDKDLVYILGRYKDLIIRGGENMSPGSIEQCLDSTVGIRDSQVVGIPDEIAGEVPVAVVRKTPELDLSDHQIQQKVSKELGKIFSPQSILELGNDLGLEDYPRTTSGKIKKRDLQITVAEYLSRRTDKEQKDISRSTIETLIQIWARVSGRTADSFSPAECAETFADSITMMQFCNIVGKDMGKTMAVDDLLGDVDITKQAQTVDARPVREKSTTRTPRHGPPTIADMVHAHGDEEAAGRCQQDAESMLQPYRLGWADVEDVIPTADTVALMTRRTRLRNWNQRHAYHVPNASTDDVRWAVTTCLELYPLFRSMILDHGKEQPLYIILRPSDRWQRIALSEGHSVDNPSDLSTYRLNDDSIDYAAPPGPLFKIMIVSIRNTNSAGLISSCHHSVFDALSMWTWFEDVDIALRTRRQPKSHADFVPFAEKRYLVRASPNADLACDFHVHRLKGWTRYRNALWPPQRAPQFFRGDDSGWMHVDGTPGKPDERRVLDADPQGVVGIVSSIALPSLSTVKARHGITANIVFKAAVALLSVHYTGADQAFFGATEAARVWPTATGSPSPNLPNTMDIAGPTWEIVINRIFIRKEQNLLEWLKELQEEQSLITRYASAPFKRIERLLSATDPTDTEYGLHDLVFRRHCFNWLPPSHPNYACIEEIQTMSRADIGLQWNMIHDGATVKYLVAYDDCQLTAQEMRVAVQEMLECASWIVEGVEGKGWEERRVGDCPLLRKGMNGNGVGRFLKLI